MKQYLTLKDWIGIFQKAAGQGGKLLTWASLLQVCGLSEPAARKALERLEKKGLIFRAGPGLYACRLFPPSLEEIAMAAGRPCYISFESALSRYGILSQSPMVLTCATRKKPGNVQTPAGEFLLRHICAHLFWGFREEKGVLWAEPEKALLDWLYWKRKTQRSSPAKPRHTKGGQEKAGQRSSPAKQKAGQRSSQLAGQRRLSDTDELMPEDLNMKKLLDWAQRYPRPVLKTVEMLSAAGPG